VHNRLPCRARTGSQHEEPNVEPSTVGTQYILQARIARSPGKTSTNGSEVVVIALWE